MQLGGDVGVQPSTVLASTMIAGDLWWLGCKSEVHDLFAALAVLPGAVVTLRSSDSSDVLSGSGAVGALLLFALLVAEPARFRASMIGVLAELMSWWGGDWY